jgi:hypothetical protein
MMKLLGQLSLPHRVILISISLIFISYFFSTYEIEFVGTSNLNMKISNEWRQDLGEVSMAEGNRQLAYRYVNNTRQPLKITELFTSCMCTVAKLEVSGESSAYAGMKGHQGRLGPINPNLVLQPNQEALIWVNFDPNAHGPQGTGPFTRSVILTTDNPATPTLEFTFIGTVVP